MRAILTTLILIGLLIEKLDAADKNKPLPKPLRALLITGGCCHDYAKQKDILQQGLERRINIKIDHIHSPDKSTKPPLAIYGNPDYAKDYDLVIHDECSAGINDPKVIAGVLAPHKKGIPGVNLHCAMHSYRFGNFRAPVKLTDDNAKWFEYIGLQSSGHGPQRPIDIKFENGVPFITKGVKNWTTEKEELYNNIQVLPTAKIIARGEQGKSKAVVAWTNNYHGTRVFSTSLGHNNVTVADARYLNLVARGILWATQKENWSVTQPKGESFDLSSKPKPASQKKNHKAVASVPKSAATGAKATASSEEKNKNNFASNAIDGKPSTRWCAQSGGSGQWLQVELKEPSDVENIRIIWEKTNAAYSYIVEFSSNGKDWKTIVDQSKNKEVKQITAHKVDAKDAKFFKIIFMGASTGVWGSLWEFEAHAGALPELPRKVMKAAENASNKSANGFNGVKAPDGFKVNLFVAPPEVNYPVCLTAAATGEVFVGIDEQGSLGKEKGRGRVVRCIDTDGDGKADQVNTFAKMDHPRGLIYDNGKLWVLHPPFLTLYEDTNKDGVADKQKRLIEGISTDYVSKRGADHTTNGIRMGIDGWIYIAVGDFGFTKAVGADGRVLSRRGGGIVRVRPDGTDMEIYCWGLRNILDACIDPYLNIFTRDNTNDGGGWNVRFSHIMQSAEYGYPSWYKNFPEEIFPALKDYGGGSGCGGMFYHDTRWPKPYSHGAYTCDWGLSAVFLHNPPANGPTFDAHQETFLTISRPTDIDVDASGRMYVASWHGGKFAYGGPNVGFVVQVIPEGFKPEPFPDTTKIDDMTLFELLIGPSQQQNLHSQFELLRRGPSAARTAKLNALATSKAVPLAGRIAAIFTLKQLNGVKAQADLLKLAADPEVGEFALRALTDRKGELKGLTKDVFVNALDSTNARVRTQALISLGRLNDASAAATMLPHATAPQLTKTPAQNEPNPDGVIPHIATRALVTLKPVDTLLNALNGSHSATALSVLKYIHDDKVVAALTARAAENPDPSTLTTLVRLFHREGSYTEGWWGTRPDTTGPYFAREKWSASDQIETALKIGMANASSNTVTIIKKQLIKHKVSINGLHIHEKMAKKMPLNTVSGSASEKFRKLEIQCVDGIKFNIEKFTAKTGENLALVLVNKTNMPHNLVITEPGAYEKVGAASISMLNDPKAADNHYVPNLSSVITSTYVVQPQGSHTLYFTVPKTPGDYPFLCTFPGHWQLMKGVMEVKK